VKYPDHPEPRVSHDRRLRFITVLLLPAFVGHFIQLVAEDHPWRDWAEARYWWTPGWHLYLPPWLLWGFGFGLIGSVLGMSLRRRRPWALATVFFYWAHYLTYAFRIRNHMTLMFSCMTVIGIGWLIGWASGAVDLRGRGPRSRLVDRYVVGALATVLCITYFFAGLHKTNWGFLSFTEDSAAVRGANEFFLWGGLGDRAPTWVHGVAIYGTLVVEYTFPILARLFTKTRVWFVIGLMVFHFPHVSVMNVADYPMLASAFYPALFTRGHWRMLERYLFRPSRWNVTGMAIGVALQLNFLPWWGELTIFGIFVCAWWGWWACSMLEMTWAQRRRRPG